MRKLLVIALSALFLFGFSTAADAAEQNETVQLPGCDFSVDLGSFQQGEVDLSGLNIEQHIGDVDINQLVNDTLQQIDIPQPQQGENGAEQEEAPEQPQADQPEQDQVEEQDQAAEEPAVDGNAELTADEQQMLNLVNEARQNNGLQPLQADAKLTEVARVKAQDMIDNNYFDHHSPTYGSPFDMLNQFGVEYRTAGENLAGNPSVEGAHTSLMNSDGHRANILNSSYGKVGIGIIDGGQYGKMFVQLFTG
jgi:uncharacterized YkwD family protein